VTSAIIPRKSIADISDRALLIASVVCSLLYFIHPIVNLPHLLVVILKTLSVSLLSVAAFRQMKGTAKYLLTTALLLSSLGDFFLALREEKYFVFGLLAFLTAHLVYIMLFWQVMRLKPSSANAAQKVLIGVIVTCSAAMCWWLLPVPDGLTVPVAVYLAIITLMVLSAILAGKSSWLTPVGAILFMLSDSLIALSRFKHLIGGLPAHLMIWSLYYIAQYLIFRGVINYVADVTRWRINQRT
jgi:uncharacterized membrane protein YhhN